MSQTEFILTRTPSPVKPGARIDKTKYQIVRAAILANLFVAGPVALSQLAALVTRQLQNSFEGSVMWYFNVVKLDLEARGEIRPVRGSNPQRIEITRDKEFAF